MIQKFREIISNTNNPILLGLATGLYPFLHYYNFNFTLLNSLSQFLFFSALFIIIPVAIFFLLGILSQKNKTVKKFKERVFSIANMVLFAGFVVLVVFGLKKKILLLVIIGAIVLGALLFKHLKKVVVLQILMAIMMFFQLTPELVAQFNHSIKWLNQPDTIEGVSFKKKPNIYVVQPDGYVNFSELSNSLYNYNNYDFKDYLKDKDFKIYNNFRSNYFSTLSSNVSMFAMKHHYYNSPKRESNEMFNARNIIVGKNPVLSVLKNNGYKTFLMLEKPYLLVNRPSIAFDSCNVSYKEMSYLSKGFDVHKDIFKDLKTTINRNRASNTNNFYFIEKLKPSHISVYKSSSLGKEKEREKYLRELQKTNDWLKKIIDVITKEDESSLIVVMADHGGFVGMDYSLQSFGKLTERDLVFSIFSSVMAVKWPTDDFEYYDDNLKTPVNLFRIMFSYLSEEPSYLENLQEDKSYIIIKEGAPFGVYEYIDENDNVVFNKHSNN